MGESVAQTYRRYLKEIYKELGYIATWLPHEQVAPGDIGRLEDGRFHRLRSIAIEGVTFSVRETGAKRALEHRSEGAVSISLSASGATTETLTDVCRTGGMLNISLSEKGAVFLHAGSCQDVAIEDQQAFIEEVSVRLSKGDWPDDQVLVTNVVRCQKLTLLIAGEGGGRATFQVDAQAAPGGMEIADLMAKSAFAAESSIATSVLGEEDLTPMFKAIGVKRSWPVVGQRRAAFRRRSGIKSGPAATKQVRQIELSDLFDPSEI